MPVHFLQLNVNYLEQLIETPLRRPTFHHLIEKIESVLEVNEIKSDPLMVFLLKDHLLKMAHLKDEAAYLIGKDLECYNLLFSLTDRVDGLCYLSRNALLDHSPNPEAKLPLSYLFPDECLAPDWERFLGVEVKEIACTRDQRVRIESILAQNCLMIQMPEGLNCKKIFDRLSNMRKESSDPLFPFIEMLAQEPDVFFKDIKLICGYVFFITRSVVDQTCKCSYKEQEAIILQSTRAFTQIKTREIISLQYKIPCVIEIIVALLFQNFKNKAFPEGEANLYEIFYNRCASIWTVGTKDHYRATVVGLKKSKNKIKVTLCSEGKSNIGMNGVYRLTEKLTDF